MSSVEDTAQAGGPAVPATHDPAPAPNGQPHHRELAAQQYANI